MLFNGYDNIYLDDLESIGFIVTFKEIIKRNFFRDICSCDAYLGDKKYCILVAQYHNGSPAKLYDVLGQDFEEKRRNENKIIEMITHYRVHDINGLGDAFIHRFVARLLHRVIMIFASIIALYDIHLISCGEAKSKNILALIFLFLITVGAMCYNKYLQKGSAHLLIKNSKNHQE